MFCDDKDNIIYKNINFSLQGMMFCDDNDKIIYKNYILFPLGYDAVRRGGSLCIKKNNKAMLSTLLSITALNSLKSFQQTQFYTNLGNTSWKRAALQCFVTFSTHVR